LDIWIANRDAFRGGQKIDNAESKIQCRLQQEDFKKEIGIQNPESKIVHRPVMPGKVLEFLRVRPDGVYIDATLGAGGHAEEILKDLRNGRLLGIDRDPKAINQARQRLREFEEKLIVLHGNFADIDALHARSGLSRPDGILADLGMSSLQVDDAARGFSFNRSGPLDMRMDPGMETTAGQIVNQSRERELADMIFRLGEERHSRRIARAIVKARPIRTTTELAQVVSRAIPYRAGLHHIHPATRTFQALRLAVNRELESLAAFLSKVLAVLAPGGRLVMLSFHSLEDRMVKQAFQGWQREGGARVLTRKVVRPSEEEVLANPRSRSAKLRAAEKVAIAC
jgi:16S rRNA (cytosine1402-N4)-methyltransferase